MFSMMGLQTVDDLLIPADDSDSDDNIEELHDINEILEITEDDEIYTEIGDAPKKQPLK